MRQSLQSQGIQVPETASAFDIVTRPEYRNIQDQLPQGVKVSLLQDAQNKQGSLDEIDTILKRVENNSALVDNVRAAGSILSFVRKFTNTPEGAIVNQMVEDLKSHGIVIDDKTTLAGARQKLLSQKAQVTQQIDRFQTAIGSNRISDVGKTVTSPSLANQKPSVQTKGLIPYINTKTGQRALLTPQQAQKAEASGGIWRKL